LQKGSLKQITNCGRNFASIFVGGRSHNEIWKRIEAAPKVEGGGGVGRNSTKRRRQKRRGQVEKGADEKSKDKLNMNEKRAWGKEEGKETKKSAT